MMVARPEHGRKATRYVTFVISELETRPLEGYQRVQLNSLKPKTRA
jgi:hypothetical protein